MSNQPFRIHYCVPPDHQFLMAEIYFKNEHFGELNTEHGQLELVLFPRASGAPWTIPLEDMLSGLQEAHFQLVERSNFFAER